MNPEPTTEPAPETTMTEDLLSLIVEQNDVLINRIEFLILILIFLAFLYTFNTLRRYKRD